MAEESQDYFVFEEGSISEDQPDEPLKDFFTEVSKIWNVPLFCMVRVRLHDGALPELKGRLRLAHAPAFPLDRCEPLALTLCGVEFTHRDIAAWTLLE